MEDKRLMKITTEFDGELMWTWMENTYSWLDHKYSHTITLAMTMQNLSDICDAWKMAFDRFTWVREVFPQLLVEVGDMSFTEMASFNY